MILIPAKDETIVLPIDFITVFNKLVNQIDMDNGNPNKLFNGRINNNIFKISQKIKRPDNYIPLIIGKIEETSKGSIIFLKYRLMFSTKMFLIFWSVILILLTLFFSIMYEAYLYAGIAAVLGGINYAIVYYNFKKKVKINHELLIKLLE